MIIYTQQSLYKIRHHTFYIVLKCSHEIQGRKMFSQIIIFKFTLLVNKFIKEKKAPCEAGNNIKECFITINHYFYCLH